jgi:hypothetical protein
LQPIATGFQTVFKYFEIEATGNLTDPKPGQLRPMVRLQSVGLGSVSVFFPVH